MYNVQLMPISVANSTVHNANLEPGAKLGHEIGVLGTTALADAE